MIKWISHRGCTIGPAASEENKPEYIIKALNEGYDVEIDVWKINDEFLLGHDKPTYKITRFFLQNKKLWCHCKNVEAFMDLSRFDNVNCFMQEDEELVYTSRGYLWAHSKSQFHNEKTVITKLDSRNWTPPKDAFAVCSDFVGWQSPEVNKLPFELLIIDIDGVMTDGTKMYDREGKVFGKQYCDLDFTAIKRFKAAGIKVCFLSGDKLVNEIMAETRKIDFFHNEPGTDKVDVLSLLKKHYSADKIAYVGDDYYDLAIMNAVGLAFCPKTSFKPLKNAATVIDVDAGKGVIAGLYDMYEDEINYVFPIDSKDVNPK